MPQASGSRCHQIAQIIGISKRCGVMWRCNCVTIMLRLCQDAALVNDTRQKWYANPDPMLHGNDKNSVIATAAVFILKNQWSVFDIERTSEMMPYCLSCAKQCMLLTLIYCWTKSKNQPHMKTDSKLLVECKPLCSCLKITLALVII